MAQIARALRQCNTLRCTQTPPLPHVYLHTDASQAVGKLLVHVDTLGVDYVTLAGHKFYGPRMGLLYRRICKPGFLLGDEMDGPGTRETGKNSAYPAPLYPIFFGGGQEYGLRSGYVLGSVPSL